MVGKPYISRLPILFVFRYFVPKCSQSSFAILQVIVPIYPALYFVYCSSSFYLFEKLVKAYNRNIKTSLGYTLY